MLLRMHTKAPVQIHMTVKLQPAQNVLKMKRAVFNRRVY